jgi:hypothetical protein
VVVVAIVHAPESLEDKYKEIDIVGCGCSGNRSRAGKKASPAPQVAPRVAGAVQAQAQQAQGTQMNDQDFVRAEYLHPNKGTHQVSGQHRFPVPIDKHRLNNRRVHK